MALLGSALAVMGIATSTNAQDAQYAHAAITAGHLTSAERSLERETRAGSREPEVLLNLAAVYAMTQRPDAARDLYAKVLAGKDVSMAMPSAQIASAHDVARRGLQMLDRPATMQLTSR
ncbi:tetratricopeptide repeat protein [Sphingomonas sp. 2R-10]|uniref:tetratricopeptide repeat protein n=1 Tax=Sphingomonas sp. 2R-10 TaxID=3045148 RepID=UPI000F787BF0|nr:tetratricopeptide repeat protein [Sphingomonas sp. 2R-10]MDJ0275948.1 tetratricopeptide repeat protein [Sphingomonas sp. 2R-10]